MLTTIYVHFAQKRHLGWICTKTGYSSRKHTYIILTPLSPTFITYYWGLQGYTLFFLFLLKNIDCGYSLEPPRRGGSNEYPQSMFWAEIWKISELLLEDFQFVGGEFFYIFQLACFRNAEKFPYCIYKANRLRSFHRFLAKEPKSWWTFKFCYSA